MSILVNADSRILVQGLTGREGQFHARQMLDYGTNIVAGCTPGKGGMEVLGVPVFNTCAEAVKATGADVSIIFVPSAAAADRLCRCGSGHQAGGADHRAHPRAGHGAGQGIPQRPRHQAHRPQLPRHHHARGLQAGHHARLHIQTRPHRSGEPFRHPDL